MTNSNLKRVLSIQSHVVYGYVGNKSATFPLQLLGYDVDPLNTVQFSNHTGYPKFSGIRLNAENLLNTFKGLEDNNLVNYSHILVGYLGSEELISAVRKMVLSIKERNPKAIFVLDPVMGDDGALYVPKELVKTYIDLLCPLADIITPNQTEAEFLTGMKLNSKQDLLQCFEKFHKLGIENVVITSSETDFINSSSSSLFLYGSTSSKSYPQKFFLEIPTKPYEFSGTGDLFSALLLAHFKSDIDRGLQRACEQALSVMQGVLDITIESIKEATDSEGLPEEAKIELNLIRARDSILYPKENFLAIEL